ncbi:hypothetical protein MNBD_NITROSPIRAE01-1775 [hydrothermal vent metagenome]|uniref:Right handed beta helix domain-containing protein n=1 Tax=hydrothermal vent metagenome TaxID=652676 RepID=A0A3B1CPU2_9ZZZZ
MIIRFLYKIGLNGRSTLFKGVSVFVGLFFSAVVNAGDYYVDNAVSVSGDGTISSPFQAIQEGIDVLGPGDRLLIRGDTTGQVYSETLSFSVSGNASQVITMRAYENEKVILTGSSGSRFNIREDYWTIENLIIDQANISADAIRINGNNIIFRNLEIRNGRREGIAIQVASFITIEDSYIHDFMRIESGVRIDAHCIIIETDRSPNITNIKILRNTIERCSGDGIQIFGTTGQDISEYAKNVEIIGNTFIDGTAAQSNLTENALDFKAGDTVLVKDNVMRGYTNNKTVVVQKGCRNITFEGNTISDGDRGIEMRQEGGTDFIQLNNSIKNNLIYNIASYALGFDGVKNISVVNNTLVNIAGSSFRFESTLGTSTPSVDGGIIKNNLVYQSGSPGVKDAFSNLDIAFNGWFQASAGDLSQASDTTGTNPLFVDEATDDYRLQALSLAVNAGVDVGASFFESAPDLGAFEYNPGGDTTPPDPPTGISVE